MENSNSKMLREIFLESFERIRKSLMTLTKILAEMAFDT